MQRDYRVLLVDLARSFGGAEVRVLTQARALQDRVAACSVATMAGSTLHQHVVQENLPYELVNRSPGSPAVLLELVRIIRRGGYQIIDCHNVHSILWGHLAALLAGARGRVSTIHSDYGAEYPGLKGKFYEGVLAFDRRLARQFITVTEGLQAKAEQHRGAAHSTLIYNAVLVPDQPRLDLDPAARAGWGYTDGDFIVASIARLKPVKGQAYLVDAIAALPDLPQVKLLIVGDGPLRADLERQVERLGLHSRVQFAGFRQDVQQILSAVDCVCMASLSEALPYVVLEAAAAGRPLLVTAVGGMATLLRDGETACLVSPKDSKALAEGIRWLVNHPAERQQLALAAYRLVRQKFSMQAMIEDILQVYDQALR